MKRGAKPVKPSHQQLLKEYQDWKREEQLDRRQDEEWYLEELECGLFDDWDWEEDFHWRDHQEERDWEEDGSDYELVDELDWFDPDTVYGASAFSWLLPQEPTTYRTSSNPVAHHYNTLWRQCGYVQ